MAGRTEGTDSVAFTAVTIEDLAAIKAFVENSLKGMGCSEDTICDLVLAVHEAVENIVLHGYEGKPGFLELTQRVIRKGKGYSRRGAASGSITWGAGSGFNRRKLMMNPTNMISEPDQYG